ncbi:MAG: MBL fold metallo-hydrolase, partial [Promethearchaeota archaeon]
MRVIFLGTNGWYATDIGNTVSTLIDSKNYYIILDAGDGIYKIDQYIKNNKPIIVLLSHLHLDH